jgi:hypothetical protein
MKGVPPVPPIVSAAPENGRRLAAVSRPERSR